MTKGTKEEVHTKAQRHGGHEERRGKENGMDFPRKDRQQVKTVINPRRGNHGKTKNIHERI
jgi:hypothetical protein